MNEEKDIEQQSEEDYAPTCDILIQIGGNGAYRCGEPAINYLLMNGTTIWYCHRDAALIPKFKQKIDEQNAILKQLAN